jgi:hypothetical protein
MKLSKIFYSSKTGCEDEVSSDSLLLVFLLMSCKNQMECNQTVVNVNMANNLNHSSLL